MQLNKPRHASQRGLYVSLVAVLAALTILGVAYALGLRGNEDRREQVAESGAQVMPFDLERTTHTFTDLPSGGRESVVSDDGDAKQIALIRSHLREEVGKFAAGDFSDPARIHGGRMPGLAALRAGSSRIEFRYEELSDGAAIAYRTDDPALISALHEWFAAQRSDHGRHAEQGH